MNTLKIVKTLAGMISGLGVGMIVANIITSTTPEDVKRLTKILIYIGGIALSGYVGAKAGQYVEDSIDDIATQVKNMKPEPEKTVAETK